MAAGNDRDIGLGAVDVDRADRSAFGEDDPRIDAAHLMLCKNLTLAQAREKAAAPSKLAKAGFDPVAERDRARVRVPAFAETVIAAQKTLVPIWTDKPVMVRKVRSRIGQVLAFERRFDKHPGSRSFRMALLSEPDHWRGLIWFWNSRRN